MAFNHSGMKPGSTEHRDLFCRTFIESHVPFEPEALPWPKLDGLLLERLRTFPFWSYARSIEHRAGRMVSGFAQTLPDPLIREAVALQGVEEARHGRLMAHVTERYGVDAPLLPIPDLPANGAEFTTFGFGECTDSFIGFGGFAIARRKQLFPDAMMAIFENVLWEEARHIVFFINWWRYEQVAAGRDGVLARYGDALRWHVRAVVGTAEDAGAAPSIDLATIRGLLGDVTPGKFLAAALAENRRHMARFDRRLLRPRIVPTLATLALLGVRMLPPRAPHGRANRPQLAA
jgi:hypothetical protein